MEILLFTLLAIIATCIYFYYPSSKRVVVLVGPSLVGKTRLFLSLLGEDQRTSGLRVRTLKSIEPSLRTINDVKIIDLPGSNRLEYLRKEWLKLATTTVMVTKDRNLDVEMLKVVRKEMGSKGNVLVWSELSKKEILDKLRQEGDECDWSDLEVFRDLERLRKRVGL